MFGATKCFKSQKCNSVSQLFVGAGKSKQTHIPDIQK